MGRLRINEAIARADRNGKRIKKKELATLLWPESSAVAQQVNMTKLCNGTTRRVEVKQIEILCKELGCDANYLFGM